MTILQEAIDKSYQWVIITDSEGKIIYANDTVSNLSGFTKSFLIGKTPKIFKSNYHDQKFYKNLWETISKGMVFEDIFVEKSKDRRLFYLRLKIIPIDINGERYYVSLGIDITKEKELQTSLLTDEVTKLFNRKGFLIEANKKLTQNAVLLLIDIRNFKALNQVKGYFYGDLILKEFSEFLKTFFYEEDLIAKIGGDEFAVLLNMDNISKIIKIVEKLIKKAKKIENIDLNIGIAFYPKDAGDINALLEKAFAALEYAKREGSGVYKFYNEDIKEEIEFLLNAKSLISRALREDLFTYYFQPYYSIKEDKIVGFEALLRIIDNDKVLTPYYFIDYAEESGIIKDIEEHMYKKLPEIYKQLNSYFSVNLSLSSFHSDKHVRKLLANIKNLSIGIELTEREVAKDITLTKNILKIIKDYNLKISIDDFGTGYSSFLYIKELDFDVLKIDMSFIKNIHKNEKDLALVKTLVTLAKELNLTTIAEGVEEKEQLEILNEIGCDIAQGFLIAKPMPLKDAVEFKKNFKGLR
jgi:diguanylate cyclase (GGDEF)-like protein/PAS domain S-box-containing protein